MRHLSAFAFLLLAWFLTASLVSPAWGFYGHRKVNRMAVFSLPQEMLGFYKKNIEYITEHAVDPDKRRYATKHEAVRHYIDIDHWGSFPFDNVPRRYYEAILKFSKPVIIDSRSNDSTFVDLDYLEANLDPKTWTTVKNKLEYQPDENPYSFSLPGRKTLYIDNKFSEYGILPYWLSQYQRKLTAAFEQKDKKRILRISAEMGHYIGDAHVPLHTTENYNGQMTDQVGIHAFWESRIPELFADEEYDFFVGKAEYIENLEVYFWKVVLDSHQLLDEVLKIEQDLTDNYPKDKQWCYDERLSYTRRLQCPEFAKAYAERMDGMVEARMREAILSLSSLWYTAWVNAGQPDMSDLDKYQLDADELKKQEKLDRQFKEGTIMGREHDQGSNE